MPIRIFQRKVFQKNRKKKVFFFILKFLLIAVFVMILAGLFIFIYYAKDLPRPEKFTERTFAQSTKIFDRTGNVLLYELYGEEKRDIVALDQISDNLKTAVIATEDENFYSHFGIDFKGILRSALINFELKKLFSGGSTISQQLIRSTFLTREKTISRKTKEIILTLELERRYSKDQILEWYLNQIPFGPNIYGVETASKTYFNKPSKDLTLPEAAALTAMIQSPSRLSPYGLHKDELLARKDYVLSRLAEKKYITKDEAEKIKKEEIKFVEIIQSIKAPHFVLFVKDYLLEKYDEEILNKGGLRVYTSLDWDMQQSAEKIVAEGVKKNKAYNSYNASLVSIDPKTGEILAMVGSADWFGKPIPEGCASGVNCFFDPKVNIATYNIGRQPGSAFKPFVYATAFEKGHDDKTIEIDEETNFGTFAGKPYIPRNYDGLFRGPVTLRNALAQSLNVPSVKVLAYLAGVEDSIKTAKKMGITTLNTPSDYGLSIVLGGGEVKLLDITSAYGVFANDGIKVPPVSILKIEDSAGNIIEENAKTPRRILEEKTARLINDILSDNDARAPIFGKNSVMYFENRQVAAKTGTTSDYRDGWIIGYTPSIVTGVWAGNNNNIPMSKEPGIVIAGPIWRAFMDKIFLKLPQETFLKPDPLPTQP